MENKLEGVQALKKYKIGMFSMVAMMYCACAGGAFGVEAMITESGPGMTIVILILLPVVWSLPFCLCIAEMASLMPVEGGAYVWIKETLGEFWGFVAGALGGISYYVSNAVYVVLAVGYLSFVVEMTEVQAFALKIGLVLLFTLINLLGVREVGKVGTVLSVIVIAAFFAVAVVGFMNWHHNPMEPFVPEGMGIGESIGSSVAVGIWMYCGYTSIAGIAGEVENPQVIPKALLISLPLIVATYVLPTLAGLASVGQWESWSTESFGEGVGYSTVLTEYVSPVMGLVFCIVAIIAQLSVFMITLATGSRSFFVLADDNLCPKVLKKVSKKKGVPYVGILSFTAVTLLLLGFEFAVLVLIEVIFAIVGYALVCIAFFRMRKTVPVEDRKDAFVIPGGKAGMIYCGGAPLVMCFAVMLINGLEYYLGGLVLILIVPVLYILLRRRYGGLTKIDSTAYPMNPKTRLGKGDLMNIRNFLFMIAAMAIAGMPIIRLYEQSWGPEYYLEEYGDGFFGNFYGMLHALLIYGLIVGIIGIILHAVAKKVEN